MIATSPSLPVSANPVYAPGSAPAFDGGGFLPNSLPNLQLWLDADSGPTITESGNKVSQWNDKSGNGNNALQGTGADQPTFVTNHINGKAVLTFNGIVEEMDLTSDLSLTGEFTMFIVANNEDTASTRVIFGHDTDNNKIATLNPAKAFVRIIAATAGDSSQDYLDENSTGIQIIQRNSSDKIDMAFNGAAFTRLFSDVAQSGTSSWNRLGVGEGTSSWKGDIAEIIIYNRSLSTVERASVEIYLSNKWNISISAPDNIGGLQLWLDANDSSTITESGGKVSQWDDKSGNGNDAVQGTGVNQPTTGSDAQSGKNVFTFDGTTDDFMSVANDASLNFDSGTGYTIFMVVNFDGYSNQGSSLNVFLAKGASQLATDTYNLQTSSNNRVTFQSGNGEIIQNVSGTIDGAAHILTAMMDNADTRADISIELSTDTNSSATVGSDNANALIIGGDSGVVRFAGGKYAEIIIYNRPLSTNETSSVQTYLSNKWGVTI